MLAAKSQRASPQTGRAAVAWTGGSVVVAPRHALSRIERGAGARRVSGLRGLVSGGVLHSK
eukprot:6173978-Pleurochrysis_carterae.AAC.3